MRRRGIDVSHNNEAINWARVRQGGIEFAVIRAGFGWDNDNQIDKQLENNIAGCCANGIPFGFYHYSYAEKPEDAVREAKWFLKVIRGVRPEYPVAFDFEEPTQLKYSLEKQLSIIEAFMDTVEKAGYYVMLYMSASPLTRLYNYAPDVIGKYDAWAAQWKAEKPSYPGSCGIWQYDVTGAGEVPGVSTRCDVNYAYKDYPAIIKAAGLNGWAADKPQEEPDYKALYQAAENKIEAIKAILA